jgi:hypothetical protein
LTVDRSQESEGKRYEEKGRKKGGSRRNIGKNKVMGAI